MMAEKGSGFITFLSLETLIDVDDFY